MKKFTSQEIKEFVSKPHFDEKVVYSYRNKILKEKKILYIAPYVNKYIKEKRKISDDQIYQAGKSKIEGICSALNKAGFNVDILSPIGIKGNFVTNVINKCDYTFNKDKSSVFYPASINIENLIGRYLFLITMTLSTLVRLIKRNVYIGCIFYNFTPQTAIPAFFFKLITQKPIIIEYEDDYSHFDYNFFYKYFDRFFSKAVNKFLNGAICVNSRMYTKFNHLTSILVVRGVFDPVFYATDKRIGSKRIPKILFSGSLNEMRGIDILIHALENITNRIEVIITGKGPLEYLVRKGIQNPLVKLCYKGHVSYEEYIQLLKEVDIAISCYKTSHSMNNHIFPSKIIEYMAYGKIVITSKVSDINTIREKDIFIFYEEDNPKHLASVIDRVASNLEYYKKYGDKARHWVEENCSTDGLAVKLKKYIIDLCRL